MINKPKNFLLTLSLIFITFYCLATTVHAFDYSFNGFGTLKAAQILDDVIYEGVDDDLSFYEGSQLAGQLNLSLSEDISFTYQGKIGSNPKYIEDTKYITDLAFLSYQPNNHLNLRLGRLRTPFFLTSEYLDTNFLLPWNEAPVTVYKQAPILKYEGLDIIYTNSLSESIDYEVQITAGTGEEKYSVINPFFNTFDDYNIQSDGYIKTATLSLFMDDWQLRFHHSRGKLEVIDDIPTFISTSAYPDSDTTTFSAIGIKYDGENILLMAEYGEREVQDSFLIEPINGYYITIGYKLPNFLPSLTYGYSYTPNSVSKDYGFENHLSFITATIKWDINEQIDIKVEFSHYHNHNDSPNRYNSYLRPNEHGIYPKSFDKFSLSVNFIF